MRSILAGPLAITFALIGCGHGNLASHVTKPPKYEGAQCKTTKRVAEPLTVEWPSVERARLESVARKGLVVVHAEGCSLEVLPECHVEGRYAWSSIVPKHDRVSIHDADDLYAALPLGAASLEGKLATKGELNVRMTIAGRFEADHATVRNDQLKGDCSGATHIVSAMSAGAFRFFAGASAAANADVAVASAKTGGSTAHAEETLNEDGVESECGKAKPDDKAPPAGCGALLRLELVALGEGKLCPPNTTWNGKGCSNSTPCGRGLVREWGSCIPIGMRYDLSAACEQSDMTACLAECDAGNAESCAEVAHRLGNEKQTEKAMTYMRKACDGGSVRACGNLGMGYSTGYGGLAVDWTKGAALMESACKDGHLHACVALASALAEGLQVPKDEAKAASLRAIACNGGHAKACWRLGDDYLRGHGVSADLAKALSLYKRSCDLGSPVGCYAVGWTYRFGKGVEQNLTTAAKYYERGCNGGEPRACTNLAIDYLNGWGVMKNLERGANLAMMSCNAGEPDGCANYAFALVRGLGVPVDLPRGLSLYRLACEDGSAPACRDLAVLYHLGKLGVKKDAVDSAALAIRACDLGDAKGCFFAGVKTEEGSGTKLDRVKAVEFYRKGCKAKNADACNSLERLGEKP